MLRIYDTRFTRDETIVIIFIISFCGSSEASTVPGTEGVAFVVVVVVVRSVRVRFAYTSLPPPPPPSYALHYNIRDRYRDLKKKYKNIKKNTVSSAARTLGVALPGGAVGGWVAVRVILLY